MSVTARRSVLTRGSQKFAGPPCLLDKTEPPTLRQVIQFSYFLENSQPHLKNFEISKLIAKEITRIWQAVNPQLPLLRERYIGQKVNLFCYKRAKQIDRKSLAATKVKRMKEQLDRLFDISSCSCKLPVLRCDDFAVKCKTENCQTRHIVCTCPPNKKVPLEDREYLKDQREKTGPKGNYQLGPVDKAAIKKYKKKSAEMDRLERQSEREEQASPSISLHSSSSEGTTDDSFDPGRQQKGPYSLLKIPRYSMELIRGDVSSNLGACLANAFLLDLKHMGLLHPKLNLKNIVLDKSKIYREKARIKLSSHVKHAHQNENLVCVGVDCRVDKDTLQYKDVVDENGEKNIMKNKGAERHLTFTRETGTESKYLTHRVIPNLGATGVLLAEDVAAVLREYNSVDTVKAILVDNASTNTGCEAGLITALEKKINKKLHTIGCSLHQNELSFRAIFKSIDGTTRSPTTFTGPLGKLCLNNYQDLPQVEFQKISGPLDHHYLTIEETNTLSGDQRLLFEYAVGISRGEVNPRYAAWKIGPLNQARWLTLATRLMCIWTRGVYPQTLYDKLNTLVKFIIQVYAVSWFEIKNDNNFYNQQLYIFNTIQRTKQQSNEIQKIVFNSLKYSAFALLPENILISMINSNDLDVREEAIKKILYIRNSEPPKKRLKKITAINFSATHWSYLIDLSQKGVCEPALIECFSNEELKKCSMTGSKLELPKLPAHSQGVERAVKLTTEASQVVYGQEARHRHIVTKSLCHQVRLPFSSKGNYTEQFSSVIT